MSEANQVIEFNAESKTVIAYVAAFRDDKNSIGVGVYLGNEYDLAENLFGKDSAELDRALISGVTYAFVVSPGPIVIFCNSSFVVDEVENLTQQRIKTGKTTERYRKAGVEAKLMNMLWGERQNITLLMADESEAGFKKARELAVKGCGIPAHVIGNKLLGYFLRNPFNTRDEDE